MKTFTIVRPPCINKTWTISLRVSDEERKKISAFFEQNDIPLGLAVKNFLNAVADGEVKLEVAP